MGILYTVAETLSKVEVKGEANMNYLLWSIQTLKRLDASQRKEAEEKPQEEKENG